MTEEEAKIIEEIIELKKEIEKLKIKLEVFRLTGNINN